MLGLTESAEYAGATSGSKDQLLADIMDTHNWRRGVGRRLNGFSIATGSNATTVTMTTTMTVTVAEGTETKVTWSDWSQLFKFDRTYMNLLYFRMLQADKPFRESKSCHLS